MVGKMIIHRVRSKSISSRAFSSNFIVIFPSPILSLPPNPHVGHSTVFPDLLILAEANHGRKGRFPFPFVSEILFPMATAISLPMQ